MPFPRAKANLYDVGTRVPLAARWPERIVGAGHSIDDFVSLTDIAPTILHAAGLETSTRMTGRSLYDLFIGDQTQLQERLRDFIVFGFERNNLCRPEGVGYPMRAVRTRDFLYIRNYEPDRWPAGNPDLENVPSQFGDVDPSPTKDFMLEHKDKFQREFDLCFAKHPAEELYDVSRDPDQLDNLLEQKNKIMFEDMKRQMKQFMEKYMRLTHDPRLDRQNPWDEYPYYVRKPTKEKK